MCILLSIACRRRRTLMTMEHLGLLPPIGFGSPIRPHLNKSKQGKQAREASNDGDRSPPPIPTTLPYLTETQIPNGSISKLPPPTHTEKKSPLRRLNSLDSDQPHLIHDGAPDDFLGRLRYDFISILPPPLLLGTSR